MTPESADPVDSAGTARARDTVVAVLGGGRIGEALLGGLGAAGGSERWVVERDRERSGDLVARLGVGATDAPDAARRADVLVVAVKPADVVAVLAEVHDALAARTVPPLVVSLAAGVTTATLEAALPPDHPVVRVMPNTPMLVGRAMCVLSAGRHAGEEHLAAAESLLGRVGRTVRVPEHQQDVATALSGSGPAYVLLLAEAMVEAGVALGLPRPVATELVSTTVDGTGGLLLGGGPDGGGAHPALLREAVTSPGGTTAAALAELEAHGLRAATAAAVRACRDASRALGG